MSSGIEQFKQSTSVEALGRLASQARIHAQMLDEQSLETPHVDYRLARRLADVLSALAQVGDQLDGDQRAVVGAAARYFVLTEDDASDLEVDGLLDDAAALADVCRQVGREDLAAELEAAP